jgi:sterol desaturase/sphingolipid hydroxylase (fatty acid hydroxylase superfamily)
MHWTILLILNAAFPVVLLLIVRQFEKRNPIEAVQVSSEVIADWKLAGLKWVANQFLSPLSTACAFAVITAVGGGFIPLRTDGWWYLFSFVVLIIAIDFWSYVMHYASHRIPVLWAMHSLHHSAEALSMVTGARHFWLEQPLLLAVFPILGIIFKVPAEMVIPIGFVYFLFGDGLVHLNMRVSFGHLTLILNNPQYHRIHHSIEPQHQDKNFCKMFPIFDVIFGTAWKPGNDEFPRTGLIPRERATGFIDGLIWPLRNIVPRAVPVVRTP